MHRPLDKAVHGVYGLRAELLVWQQVTDFKVWTEAMKANRIAELLHVCRGHHDAISKLKMDQ